MSSIYDLIQRYVGRRVSITIHAHTRLIGKVASIHDHGVLWTDRFVMEIALQRRDKTNERSTKQTSRGLHGTVPRHDGFRMSGSG